MTQFTGFVLQRAPWPGQWADAGRCRTAPPSIFFGGRGDSTAQAKAICRPCPVIEQCREYAIPISELQGVFGGLSAKERREIRHDRAAAAAEAAVPSPGPGPGCAPRGSLYRVLEDLTGHPGNWARVGHFAGRGSAQTTASLLRTGRREIPPGRFSFEGRIAATGSGSDLWARFDGPEAVL